jgi:hypothetical protein
MKKKFIIILSLLCISSAQAGLKSLTHHSRANCVNNETISWQKGHNYWFWIVSRHKNVITGEDHQVIANWALTWRAAAVHWGEGNGTGLWTVEGHHWMRDHNMQPVEVATETVRDCSIYDGWWE